MINYAFTVQNLEYFLLIFTRVSGFVFIAPFFSMGNTPRRVKIAFSFFTTVLLYETLAPASGVVYDTVMGYALIVIKEMTTGLLLGLGASMCTAIVNFAGIVVDMETGLSMATLWDPTTRENTSISGVFYQYVVMMLLIATGMYGYLLGALADSFALIPVNGAVFHADRLLQAVIQFLGDFLMVGFRICLPVFCVTMLLNAVLGVLAKVSPQMNMFAVGIQLKLLVGLSALFFTASMLPTAADFVFVQMKKLIVAFVGGMT